MTRPNPLTIPLPPNWRVGMLRLLTETPPFNNHLTPGGKAHKDIKDLLDHPKIEEAVKFLIHASGGDLILYLRVINKAFGACAFSRMWADLHPGISTDAIRRTRWAESVTAEVSARSEGDEFRIYDLASRLKKGYPQPKLNNDTIVAALHIVGDLMSILSSRVKGPTGRPVDINQRSLVSTLDKIFRHHLGKPVSGAVAALVTATFQKEKALRKEKPLTGKDVQKMLTTGKALRKGLARKK